MTDGLRLAVVIDASVPRKVWRFIDKRTSSRRDPRSGGLLVSVHTGMFYDQLPVVVHLEYYEYLSTGCNPFRTAVPFWGQITQSLTDLSPKRDCSTKRVYSVGVMGSIFRRTYVWSFYFANVTNYLYYIRTAVVEPLL